MPTENVGDYQQLLVKMLKRQNEDWKPRIQAAEAELENTIQNLHTQRNPVENDQERQPGEIEWDQVPRFLWESRKRLRDKKCGPMATLYGFTNKDIPPPLPQNHHRKPTELPNPAQD